MLFFYTSLFALAAVASPLGGEMCGAKSPQFPNRVNIIGKSADSANCYIGTVRGSIYCG
ncbi:hypothetical protein E4U42_005639 [Claviceps africana]|uniref:Uncharacterized protein n=1 Tax=Claviceps africana TaxID=83212 RepID=A0A8K0J9H8_9HYPO|nr:hypothetical protein E4U42_005639 [Claviceps africana]